MLEHLFNRIFGLTPPTIHDGTVLEYFPTSSGPTLLCLDSKNIVSTWVCYLPTSLPLGYGEKVTVYNRTTLFSSKSFTLKFNNGSANVTLFKKTEGYP